MANRTFKVFAASYGIIFIFVTSVFAGHWQTNFVYPQQIRTISQINGTHDFVFTNAPSAYEWQYSINGSEWLVVPGTRITNENRLFRTHQTKEPLVAKSLKLVVHKTNGPRAVLQEVRVNSPEVPWALIINSTHERKLPGHGKEFLPLIRKARPGMRAQQINLEDFTVNFVTQEPRPLVVFMSGSFKDWCEVDRETWRGAQEVLSSRQVPIWASCGGAQGLGILATVGVEAPWDCSHCRNPEKPLVPIYSHIGHTMQTPCGDYSGCIFEKGPYNIRKEMNDPVFAGLNDQFKSMQSHCGQLNFAPTGWDLVAVGGDGSLTRIQCIKTSGYPIYAAQFHIEMTGTLESSLTIMSNFLRVAELHKAQ